MLVAYLIMLREGIEAALIVGIIAGYLKQTGRERWMPSVWLGVALALALCVVIGVALNYTSGEFPQRQQEFFEGAVAVAAVAILTSMVFWMKKAARSIKAELQHSVDAALRPGDRQGWALVGMAFLAVGREGLESVFFLLATFQQSVGPGVPVGAALGLLTAVGIGVAITYGGMRLDLRRFFRWTGVFIIFVAAGLLSGALRAFHEAGLWNGLQERAFDLSGILPVDSVLGTLLSGLLGYQDSPAIGEVLAYVVFLVPALILFFTQSRPVRSPRPA
ncbi:iron uptake transporter permease EfeU [Lichenifustis flavocetrariae]|uniref:FTR1 family protein n=1 Tax=Lichenifustis flavocetrariae TaxID=2949735 RepID=A0AA42CHX5_9HYPH|nr:iron uptake transporter permease EfeU [Lichenifustis flavocetrariae]MCW6507998.1 FTR1 family protein [Lichenifustis flavocetrariae]